MSEQVPSSPTDLPELSDAALDRMEDHIFDRIAAERTDTAHRAQRRRRNRIVGWTTSAAAVVVLGLITVPVLAQLGGSSSGGSAYSASSESMTDGAVAPDAKPEALPEGATGDMTRDGSADTAVQTAAGSLPGAVDPVMEPQVITNAYLGITVDDVPAGAEKITALATAAGGFIASQNIGTDGYPMPVDTTSSPAVSVQNAYVTIRVPATALDGLLKDLSGLGTVTSTNIDRQDVTAQTIDLTARVGALQKSVERLEQLMTQAGSVGDLIAAESALTDRQATLESYQQQLDGLKDQVAMSTVSVQLTQKSTVKADGAGFTDGWGAGWEGLIATFNGLVIVAGFLIPWLLVLGAAFLIVWLIVRGIRRARRPHTAKPSTD